MLRAGAAIASTGAAAQSTDMDDVFQRLDNLIAQLSANHLDQRLGALHSINFKLQCGIITVSDLAHKESLFKALLEWFNGAEVPNREAVLQILLMFAEVSLAISVEAAFACSLL
jgi:hypothetical protein